MAPTQDDAVTEAPDEFDSFLQDAEERFREQETVPEPVPEEEAAEDTGGPADLRPQPLDPE